MIKGSILDKHLLCDSMKGYKIIEFPFPEPWRELTKKQAAETFNWFLSEIPNRLEILFNAIGSSGHPEIVEKLDYSPKSLVPLALWLSIHSHTRKKSPEEHQKSIESVKHPVLKKIAPQIVSDWTWMSETVSLTYDVGIYLSKVFQKRYENVRWNYVTKPKNHIYVNKPILEGFETRMSPADIVLTCVIKMKKMEEGPEVLKRLYDVWVERLIRTNENNTAKNIS